MSVSGYRLSLEDPEAAFTAFLGHDPLLAKVAWKAQPSEADEPGYHLSVSNPEASFLGFLGGQPVAAQAVIHTHRNTNVRALALVSSNPEIPQADPAEKKPAGVSTMPFRAAAAPAP